MYVPLLNRMRNNIVDMGLQPERLYAAMNRFKKLGERGEYTQRVPLYQVLKVHAGDGGRPQAPLPPARQHHGLAERALPARAAPADPDLVQGAHLRAGQRRHRSKREERAHDGRPSSRRAHDALVIGAGFTGLGTAIKLREAGVDDVVILERADRVGGTWRDATYPGAACDIPSLLYSFSFATNPDWSRAYSPSAEIRAHIESLVDRFDLAPHLRFGAEVTALTFDEDAGAWEASSPPTGDDLPRPHRGRGLRPAADASLPDIRGHRRPIEGHKILSARWDHDYDLAGKNVAVIGTGASAVQIIPELVKTAGVGQGLPAHARLGAAAARPRRRPGPAQAVFRALPASSMPRAPPCSSATRSPPPAWSGTPRSPRWSSRPALAHLRLQVKDPWLRRQLTPDFRAGCKRMLMSQRLLPGAPARTTAS